MGGRKDNEGRNSKSEASPLSDHGTPAIPSILALARVC
jgi:hypothetical protein